MKVAFFTGFTNWNPHYDTELELIDHHLGLGDSVHQFVCNGELRSCDANFDHDLEACMACISKRENGLKLVEGNVQQKLFLSLGHADRAAVDSFCSSLNIKTLQDLKDVQWDDFDVGLGVLSSLISHVREPRPDIADHFVRIDRVMRSALAVYLSVRNIIKENGIERFYVFNGRFAILRAVIRACHSMGVECIAHERGCDLGHYELYVNTLPHDMAHWHKKIEESWAKQQNVEVKVGAADQFYRRRRMGEVQSWYSFVAGQDPGTVPSGFDPSKKNIVIFNSSEDEFASIDKSHGGSVYESQEAGIRQIAAFVERAGGDYVLYIRVHPNLAKVDNSQTRFLSSFSAIRCHVIPGNSPVSSYALMEKAWTVVTFGSTMGVEAAYWGVPSIMVGSAFYAGLGAVHEPRSHEEFEKVVLAGPTPLPKEGALKYGHHMRIFGFPFKHYRPNGVVHGEYKGKRVSSTWSLHSGPGGRRADIRKRATLLAMRLRDDVRGIALTGLRYYVRDRFFRTLLSGAPHKHTV